MNQHVPICHIVYHSTYEMKETLGSCSCYLFSGKYISVHWLVYDLLVVVEEYS